MECSEDAPCTGGIRDRSACDMAMANYIPKIQDRLRLAGYPVNASAQYQEIAVGRQGVAAAQRAHWEFLSKDRTISVVVSDGFVVVQTSSYTSFEAFLHSVAEVLEVVASTVGGLLVHRVGLRYVDLIRPRENESWDRYVREGLQGLSSPHFLDRATLHLHQIVTSTHSGTMIVRLLQNRDTAILPPDLGTQTLTFPAIPPPTPGELLTLVDIDHFHECEPEEFDRQLLERIAWPLKNASCEVFRDSLFTDYAFEVWR